MNTVFLIAILVSLIPMIPAVIYFLRNCKETPTQATKGLLMGLNGFNIVIGLMAFGLGIMWLATPYSVAASGFAQSANAVSDPYASLAAGISTGLAAIGAGIAG